MSLIYRAGLRLFTLASLGVQAQCDGDPIELLDAAFTIEVSGERFEVMVETEAQIEQLEGRLETGEEGVVSGTLLPGDGGYNEPWTWRLDPASVHVPDMAIELCDGRPSFVEADLDYWLDTVGQFCPWGAKVVGRVR